MVSGAEAMVQCLKKEGVDLVFGYPGATIVPFYDALSTSGIRHILTRSEQGAGHAASGYARITGRAGVCIATSGPGATNLFTAIATAYSDSIPMIAITGQVKTSQLGRDVFQEVDTTGAAEPFTKYAYLVKTADELPRVFKEAFHIATTGRKGPVLIDVPMDVQEQLIKFEYPKEVNIRGYKPRFDGHPLQIKKVAEAITKAKKPLVCCGGGVFLANAQANLQKFCEEAQIPVVSTMMGISALPPSHPLYYGMLGQCGRKAANVAVLESDLLILIGARVGDRAIRPSQLEAGAQIVHIDIDSAEIGKNVGTTIPLVGDAARVLEQLLAKQPKASCAAWISYLDDMRKNEHEEAARTALDPNAFVKALCNRLDENSVYVADVGQNQLYSARNFASRGRFITTGGMGTMGYSIPAAIGAKLANKKSTVVAVCGDGSFQMSMNELATMRQHDAPIKLVIMRNNSLGLVQEIQKELYKGREFAVDLAGSPDFGIIAQAYGIKHEKISEAKECEAAISRMLSDDSAYLLECVLSPDEVAK